MPYMWEELSCPDWPHLPSQDTSKPVIKRLGMFVVLMDSAGRTAATTTVVVVVVVVEVVVLVVVVVVVVVVMCFLFLSGLFSSSFISFSFSSPYTASSTAVHTARFPAT